MKALIQYLHHRFQLLPLALLVISDVLVIQRIALPEPGFHPTSLAIFLFVLAYLFNNRVGDDIRDFEFDAAHYPERALQRGAIKMEQLKRIAAFCMAIMLLLAWWISSTAMLLVIPVISMGWLARHDFFLPNQFKQRYFFTYNALNMLQMLVLQVYIYMAVLDTWELSPLMWLHVSLVFGLSIQIEVGRKIKPVVSVANDLYSDRLRMRGALWLWWIVGALCIVISMLLGIDLGISETLMIGASVCWLSVLAAGGWWYHHSKDVKLEGLFWLSMILVYVGQNLLLAYG